MERRSCLRLLFGILIPLDAVRSYAQSVITFTGTWTLDEARSGQARDIWFISRARKFVIAQGEGSRLTIDADGSIADVQGSLIYNLDGTEITTLNHTIGDIPGWIRKVRTKGMLDGMNLVTHTGHVVETGGHESTSVTIVLTFTLNPNGREMTVERTGFRPVPPVALHGRPYRREDDLLYGKDAAVYVRGSR